MPRRLLFDGALGELGQLRLEQATITSSRLYLRSTDASIGAFNTAPVLADVFNGSTPPVYSMGPTKLSTAMATTTARSIVDGDVDSLAVFISSVCAVELDITASTMTVMLGTTRTGGVFAFPHAKAWVLQPDGSIKGVIKTAGPETSFSSIATTTSARAFASSSLSTLTLAVGDRLCVAVGAEAFNGGCDVTLRVGDTAGTDLSGAGDTDDDAPWIDLPDAVTFFVEDVPPPPPGATGVGAVTLASTVAAGTAVAVVTAVGAVELASPVAAGTQGVVGVTGTGAVTLDSTVAAGTAAAVVTSVGAVVLASPVAAGTAAAVVTSVGAVTLASTVAAGAAAAVATGAGAVELASPVVAATGRATVTAVGAVTLASPAVAGVGAAVVTAVGAVTLASPVVFGTEGVVGVTGTGAVTLDSTVAAGTAAAVVTAVGAVTLASPAVSATGRAIVVGAGAVVLASTVAAAAGRAIVVGAGAVDLASPAVAAAGRATVTAVGAVTLVSPVVDAAGRAILAGTAVGAVTLATPIVVGFIPLQSIDIGATEILDATARVVMIAAAARTHTVEADSRNTTAMAPTRVVGFASEARRNIASAPSRTTTLESVP